MFMLAFFVSAGFSQLVPWQDLPEDYATTQPTKSEYSVLKISGFDYQSDDFDTFWSLTPNVDTISYKYGTESLGDDDNTVTFKAAWDEDFIYIGFKVTDDYIAEPTDSIADYFEIYWATYPEYWQAIMDTASNHTAEVAAYARWAETGARKTGSWKLVNGPTAVWDDYTGAWNSDPWGPSETPYAISWGAPADAFLLDQVYEKLDETHYTYLAVIPWYDAMAGFEPIADTTLSFEVKLNDIDPGSQKTSLAWGTGDNNAYWSCYYAGFFHLYEDLVAPTLSSVSATVEKGLDLSVTCNEDAMIYMVPEGTTADKASIIAANVGEVAAKGDEATTINTTGLSIGNYELYAIDFGNNISDATVTEVISAAGIAQDVSARYTIYPNPVEEVIYITFSENVQRVEILNVLGQKVKPIENVSKTIDVSDLQSGIYFIQLFVDNDVITKSFIKK